MAIRYRPAVPTDTRAMFEVFLDTFAEVDRRLGSPDALDPTDDAVREAEWLRRRSLFEHLTATADRAWVAIDGDEHVVGYARSILRDDVRELTEFFVLPNVQGGGVGRELLGRAFPAEGAHHRTIVATLELPALVRYLKTGLVAQALLGYFSRAPEVVEVETDLEIVPIAADIEAALEAIGVIDRAILGHRRDPDHRWLLRDRTGLLVRRNGQVVGYAYVGGGVGPIAALEARDMPAILAAVESAAARAGESDVGCFVPMVNGAAIGHLLARGYRLDPFLATFFSDGHRPRFESYVLTSPPFFV